MSKSKKIILIFVFSFFIFLIYNTYAFAGYQELKNLDYSVQITLNGDAIVTEEWDIDITDTNTLFKTFEIDEKKCSKIENVSVKEIINDEIIEYENIEEYQYHLPEKTCYGLNVDEKGNIDASKFEIAFSAKVSGHEQKKYILEYTVKDVIARYKDCTEFYWKFFDRQNSIYCENITGKIILPYDTSDIDKIRVWGHGDLSRIY